jgi:stage V sporulation protein B
MKRSAFFEKTLVLIISNIFTGTLMFLFSILLSREIGAGGMGLYQLVMPLYIMFLCITGGGITISISKVAAEEKARGNYRQLYKTIRATCLFEITWSIIITVILIFSSIYISNNILNDKRTLFSIYAFCPALIIVSISSVLKGAYYGLQSVVVPAIIDIVEKIIRLALLFTIFHFIGKIEIQYSAAIAVLSLSIGELSSLILFYLCYKGYVKKHPGHGSADNSFQLIVNVLKLSLPLAINGILATIFTTVITILIPQRLQISGIKYENALALFGKLQGMALTIAFYPTIVIGSLNVLLIPSISEAVTFNKGGIINHRINTALRVAAITAFSSTVLLLAMPSELGQFFYNDKTLGDLLIIIAPSVPLIYFQITTFAILNGLGKQTNILINSTIVSIIDLVILYILLALPGVNIKGYAIDLIVSAVIGIIINTIVIKKSISYKFDFYNTLILPALCSAIAFIFTKYIFQAINNTPIIVLLSYFTFSILYFPLYNFTKKRISKNSI